MQFVIKDVLELQYSGKTRVSREQVMEGRASFPAAALLFETSLAAIKMF